MIDVSIIIVNWNTTDLLQQCLFSIETYWPEQSERLSREVFVVDNGSSDGSPAMVEQRFPSVRLLRNQENLGFARANNQALRCAAGRYLLLLNSDTELVSDALQAMVKFMDQHPKIGICGPQLLNSDGSPQYSCDAFPRTPLTLLRDKLLQLLSSGPSRAQPWEGDENVAVDYLIGAVLLIRRKTFEQIGELDERFFMYAEDIDWCYRAARAGWSTAYLGPWKVYHHNRGSSEKSPALSRRLQRLRSKNLLRFYRKHYGWPSFLFMKCWLFLKQTGQAL